MMGQGFHIGTSGWTYDDWAGVFYPPEVKGSERLTFYAQRFDALEINATFYRLPSPAMLAAWNRRLPAGYHLVLKGSRVITHRRKLAGCGQQVATFLERALSLTALKVILWQLPPSLGRDLPRLEAFLALLPPGVRHAVEFRHPSWWDPGVAQTLARHGAAFVAVSHPSLPVDILPTADFLYLRFHGLGQELYSHDYTRIELEDWARRLRPALAGRELYAFFNNTYDGRAVRNALLFRDLLALGPGAPGPGAPGWA